MSAKAGWTRVAFGDVVRLVRERSSDPEGDGFERYVGLEHIDPGDLRVRRWGNVSDGTTFTNVFRSGQVLFGKRRAYQRKVAVADFHGVCSGDIYVLESKSEHFLPELLAFICQTDGFFDHAVGTSAGSLSPRTNWNSLAAFEFPLPPLDEQRRIAQALASSTALVDSLVRMEDSCDGVLRSSAASEFEQLRANAVPVVPLGSLCSRGPQSGIYKSEEFRGTGVRIVNMGELFGNDVVDDRLPMQRVSVTAAELQRYALTPHDLLFGRRSVVLEGAGRCVLVGQFSEPTVFESSVLRVTINPEQACSTYVFEWLRSPLGHQQIKKIVTFTTVSGVAGSSVARLPIPLPDLRKQKEIAERLSRLRRTSRALRARLASTRQLSTVIAKAVFR